MAKHPHSDSVDPDYVVPTPSTQTIRSNRRKPPCNSTQPSSTSPSLPKKRKKSTAGITSRKQLRRSSSPQPTPPSPSSSQPSPPPPSSRKPPRPPSSPQSQPPSSPQSRPPSSPQSRPPSNRKSTSPSPSGRQLGNPSSSLTNPHDIEFKDDMQRMRYEKLVRRPIRPTKYLDEHTLSTLGLLDDVKWMINRVGWNYFVTLKEPTYEKLTLEFLSSVKCQILKGPDCDSGLISFRLLNHDYDLTLAQFNEIYGFPIGGERRSSANYTDFREHRFWAALSKTKFSPNNNRASNIHNPCFWYVHRFMTHTVFARGETHGTLRKSEVLLLWAMINEAAVDSGSWLARQFQKVSSASVGMIEIGGLITPIARKLGIDLSSFSFIPSSRVDIIEMLNAKIIVKVCNSYHLVVKGHDATYPLPCTELTTVQNRNSWIVPDDAGTRIEQPQEEAPHDSAGFSFAAPSPPRQSYFDSASLHRSIQELSVKLAAMQDKQEEMHCEARKDREMLRQMQSQVGRIFQWLLSKRDFCSLPT